MAEPSGDERRRRVWDFLGPPPAGGPAVPDRYEIREKIGEGAMAVVYRAWDRNLSREVALKVLKESLASKAGIRERFQREARAMAGLSHTNVVTVHDAGVQGGKMFLVMELVPGRSFRDLMGEGEDRLKRLVPILEKVARGVEAANDRGIVHRDLKPENILVTGEGEPKVSDFGVAHLLGPASGLTRTGAVMGTPLYMAPEQVRGEAGEITRRTDVYALGVILYEVLTGRPPLEAGSATEVYRNILMVDPEPPRRRMPGVPVDLDTVCMKALEKNPGQRYASAAEFGEDLRRYRTGEPILAHPPTFITRIRKKLARRRGTVAAVAAALLAAVAVGVWAVPRWLEERESRKRSEAEHEEYLKARALADRHLDEGRRFLIQLDRLMTTEDPSEAEMHELAEKARAEFREANRVFDPDPEALLETARSHRMEDRFREAMDWCDRAIEADPEFATAYLERALVRLELREMTRLGPAWSGRDAPEGDSERDLAESDLERVARLSRDSKEQLLASGILHLARDRWNEAISDLEKYVSQNRTEPRGWYWLAIARNGAGRPREESLEAIGEALRYRPWQPNYLNVRGVIRYDAGEYRGAADDFKAALDRRPEPAHFHLNLGNALSKLGDTGGAIREYTHALEIDDKLQLAWLYRGQVHARLGNRSHAFHDFSRVLQLDPRNADAYWNRGNLHAHGGDFERAREDYTEAIRHNPNMSAAYANRGNVQQSLGNPREALADYDKALRVDPGNPTILVNRGSTHLALGDFRSALADFEQALNSDPDLVVGLVGRGNVRLEERRLDLALADFSRAVELNPRHAQAWYGLGLTHEMKGDLDRAISSYRTALKHAPETGHLRESLRKALERVETGKGDDR